VRTKKREIELGGDEYWDEVYGSADGGGEGFEDDE